MTVFIKSLQVGYNTESSTLTGNQVGIPINTRESSSLEVPSYEAKQLADGDMNDDGDIVDDEYVEPNNEERDRYESRTVTPAAEITDSFYNRTTINNAGVMSGGRGRGIAPSRNLLSVQDGLCKDLR